MIGSPINIPKCHIYCKSNINLITYSLNNAFSELSIQANNWISEYLYIIMQSNPGIQEMEIQYLQVCNFGCILLAKNIAH